MQHNSGSPQQFCLRWNNYQSNLTNVFDQLLQSESFVDVTLACDGHSVKAHKMVLSACSPYFQSLFFDNPCQHPIVIMRDIKWPELKAAVEFMYKGEINVSQEQIGPLLRVAESLKIRGLADVNGEQDVVSPTSGELTSTKTSTKNVNIGEWDNRQDSEAQPRAKKRRRPSGERSSLSSPADSANTDIPEPPPSVEMSPANSATPLPPTPVGQEPLPLTLPLPPQAQISQSHSSDDMEIKPGIAEMIREEERAKLLESSHAWLGPSTSSIAESSPSDFLYNGYSQNNQTDFQVSFDYCSSRKSAKWTSEDLHCAIELVRSGVPIKPAAEQCNIPVMTLWRRTRAIGVVSSRAMTYSLRPQKSKECLATTKTARFDNNSIINNNNDRTWLEDNDLQIDYSTLLKLKSPTWTQDQLKEAIDAVVKQKMRFTQASSRYGIPKGTLYDNILGKSKRMAVLEEAGLTGTEEAAVLEFCCDVSVSPYNRRTKKSLHSVLNFVEKLRRARDPEFMFTGLSGFRWWWAFCKKHSIVSLFYDNDSYQYQLQSMWQKCWSTNQSLVHNLRFRERGPLKSWRPETMAEAIFSVLKEGLSLSQAARKYDIPYPTFVLYANRVHNMLGPSADGGSDLRPKGRGRPQRILLGVWPDEHIKGVIRAVVFRDSHHIKEEPVLAYPRMHDGVGLPPNYPNSSCSNGSEPTVSPGAAAAAAVAAVAQGLRQQMCSMMAAAQQQNSTHDSSLVNSLTLAGHCGSTSLPSNGTTPMSMSMSNIASMRLGSPAGSVQDLRISPAGSGLESPLSSPLGLTMANAMESSALNLGMGNNVDVGGIGVSGMTYKPARPFTSPRAENLFQEDIEELVKPMHTSTPRSKDSMASIKMEPLTECRGE